jgi:hypothetical protein
MKFDIIVPIYKMKTDFLERCLKSIVDQTHSEWICYIADGTPKDWEHYSEMMEIISNYVETYPNIFVYLRQSGKGVSQARNQAITMGDATHIAFLDGDDYWYPTHLEWLMETIAESEDHVVIWWDCSDVVIQFPMSNGKLHTMKRIASFFEDVDRCRQDLGHSYFYFMGHPPMTSNVIVCRDRFELVDGFDEGLQMAEDTECWMRMVADPRKEDVTYGFKQLAAAGGWHEIGPHQTIAGGQQTSAAEGGDPLAVFKEQVTRIIVPRHPRPVLEDVPEETDAEYWFWLVESTGGLGRSRLLVGNVPQTDIDDRLSWV